MIRLFVGLSLPEPLATQLETMGGGIAGARWVAARNLHVTLRFAGEVTEDVAEDLHHRLNAVRAPAMTLELAGFGLFGSRKPRALWVGIKPHPDLDTLHDKIEYAAQAVGLAAERRKFTPHVTLAWLRGASPERIAAFIAHHSPFSAAVPINHFSLYRSHLGGDGAEYEALTDYALEAK